MRCSYIFFSHRCVSPFSRRLIFTRAPVRSLYYPWGKMGTTRSLPKGWTERLPLWPFDLSFSFGRAPTSFSGSSLGKRVGIVLARERNVMRSIPGAGPILRVLKQAGNEGTSFACKWLDLRVAQMTTKNGGSVSWRRRESSIHNEYFLAWYIDTFIKHRFFFFSPDYLHGLPPLNGP